MSMGDVNLARLGEQLVERLGEYPALWFEDEMITSTTVQRRVALMAAGLRRLGVQPGDRVVVMMANAPEVTMLYQALWRAGAVVTPVIFLVTPPELAHIVTDSGAVAVVTSPEIEPSVRAGLELAGRSDLPVLIAGVSLGELEQGVDPAPIADRGGDDLAALMYTGGTTGRAKGVALSHTNLSHAGWASREVTHVPGVTRMLVALPLSHAYGLLLTVGGLHAAEPGTTYLMKWFEPKGYLRLLTEHRIQTAAMVPAMLAVLLAEPLAEYDLSALRYIYSGGAPLPPALARAFVDQVPTAQVAEGYGCTESGGIISAMPPAAPRLGTVGKPVPGVDVRILAADGTEVPAGTDGEIVVRGPNVMRSYWGGEPLADGWLHTGDVGHLDADGYLSIVDRIKDLIIRNGYNVYPRDIEDVLTDHPQVAMAAVIGRPDPAVGEEVVAYVSLTEGATVTPQELIEFARTRIAATKYPREIHLLPSIPLTSVGKIDRKALRKRQEGQAAGLAG